jgi:hypothetical protein
VIISIGGNCLPAGVALLHVGVIALRVVAVPVLGIWPIAGITLVWISVIRPAQLAA